jgi:DNA uptake protein ComE-like DNA-binding protein
LKKHLLDLSGLIDKKGVSIILMLMVLLLLFIFTATMLFMFDFWQKTAYKMFAGKNAQRFAKMGVDEAIWEIDNDDRKYDAFSETWRTNFTGEDVDLNEDGIPDSRWIEMKDRDEEVIGRYAVLVEDESGKVNINHAGGAGEDITYTVADMDVFSSIIGRQVADDIIRYREQRPYIAPSDVKLVAGVGGEMYERIKNHITCFSYDLNVNGEGEERINLNDAPFEVLYKKMQSLGYVEDVAAQTALNVIAYRQKSRVPPTIDFKGSKMFGTNKTPYFNEVDAVKRWQKITIGEVIVLKEIGGQFIELFNPYYETLDVGGWKITGVVTLFSGLWNEVMDESQSILDDVMEGETVIAPNRVKKIIENVIAANIVIPAGRKIPPRSYFTIGDGISLMIMIFPGEPPVIIPLFIPIVDPGGCEHYEPIVAINPGSLGFLADILQAIPFLSNLGLDFTMRLYDSRGNLIEHTEYIVDLPTATVGKNDPRMFGSFDWYPGKASPGKHNVTFQPWLGMEFGSLDWLLNWPASFNVKNSRFVSLSEMSLIHKKEHWKTLDFWRYGRDRKILDHFTVAENPEKPTYGKLNVNTSSETVLTCLPLVDKKLARAMVEASPYEDISEILGVYGAGKSPQEVLSKEMTKPGFDLKDNDSDWLLDTEKEKELIFSRIIDLITVRSNVFKITALGQKMQNVNNNGKIEEEILSEKKIVLWYDRRKKKVIYRREIQ